MKLKMAARRLSARSAGVPARESGPLDAAEQSLFDELEAMLYEALELGGGLERAARATSARRDDLDAAARIAEEFRRRGRAALGAKTLSC
jgi:hypothetical protein